MQQQDDTLQAVVLHCATLHRETVKVLLQRERVPWQSKCVQQNPQHCQKTRMHQNVFCGIVIVLSKIELRSK